MGSAFGQYQLVGMIGGEDGGRRYVAEQSELKSVSKTVALELVDPQIACHPDFQRRFDEASRLVQQLEHSNVGATHEMGEVNGTYFLSMEYLPGESLQTVLAKCGTRLPSEIAAWIAIQAANALQYYHELRVDAEPEGRFHGEVNPSNLFITYHGTAKLLAFDLGPVRRPSAPAQGELAPESSERLAYRAPEQDEQKPADHRSDIFSLGVVLWSCLTGRKLVTVPTGASQPIAPPRSVRANVAPVLAEIAMRALSHNRQERFQSAREMSDALSHYLRHSASQPTPRRVGQWMQEIFGIERAFWHLEISQGRDIENALQTLYVSPLSGVAQRRVSARPRELWSTSQRNFSRLEHGLSQSVRRPERFSTFPPQQDAPPGSIVLVGAEPLVTPIPIVAISTRAPGDSRRSRLGLGAMAGATGVVLAMGTALFYSSPGQHASLSGPAGQTVGGPRLGQISVRSTPDGALVFVDGEPTGLRTPALLKGVAVDRSLEVRVDKTGYRSQRRGLSVKGSAVETVSFVLPASDGFVRFAGVPPNGQVYVDNIAVSEAKGQPVVLSVGQHAIRVEMSEVLLFSKTILVVAGEQTVRMGDAQEPQ